MKGEVFTEVQAALLNSQGEPSVEVRAALEAVASFALMEGADVDLFIEWAREAAGKVFMVIQQP